MKAMDPYLSQKNVNVVAVGRKRINTLRVGLRNTSALYAYTNEIGQNTALVSHLERG